MSSSNIRRWLSYAALACAISWTLGATPQGQTAASRHIVLISLDGLPSWALDDPFLQMPTLRALAARGAIAAGSAPGQSDGHVGQPHVDGDRCDARQTRSAFQWRAEA